MFIKQDKVERKLDERLITQELNRYDGIRFILLMNKL